MKKLTGKEIIESILKELNIKAPTFSSKIKVDYSRIYDIQRGRTKKISSDVANAIINAYPMFDTTWILNGEGEMLKKCLDYDNINKERLNLQLENGEKYVPYFLYKEQLDKNDKLVEEIGRLKNLLEKNGIDYSKAISS